MKDQELADLRKKKFLLILAQFKKRREFADKTDAEGGTATLVVEA